MPNSTPAPPVQIDPNLTRQTCGKLYAKDEQGTLQKTGQWCFQFSGEKPDLLEVLITMDGGSSMAVAMGVPMKNEGELNKKAVTELRNWLTDMLQQMNEPENENNNQ